ncbi:MAG: energy transducer TonB [Steroidobacteraceae bacterium]
MRIAATFASVALLLGTSASGAESVTPSQFPRPRVAPPIPRPQPAPVWTLPFPACDRIPQTPRYPALALARGEQGAVVMWIFVAATGRISEALVSQSSGSTRLDGAAVASTQTWILEPGRQGTSPTGMWTQAVVSFRILSGEPDSAKVEVQFPKAADINRCLA